MGRGGEPSAGLSDARLEVDDVGASERGPRWRSWYEISGLSRFSALYLWAGFTLIFGLTEPAFFTSTTLTLVFGQGVVTCLVALAFLVPLAAEVYDLSVGAVMSLALCLSIYFNLHTHIPTGVGALIAVGACAVSGVVSGFIVVRMRVNSFIATLAVSQVLLALVILLSGNLQLVGSFSNTWSDLGNSTAKGIPIPDFYLLVISLILWFVLEHTPAGRYVFATGGNIEAARLSGVATGRVIWLSLIASAVISGLAGILYSMRSALFTSSVGPGYLFPAVTAVFLGASQFSQRPNVWGTLVAYFALAFGVQGLALYAPSASAWSQPLFEGVALIIAVGLAVRRGRR
jgi:ribose transport system permease protein